MPSHRVVEDWMGRPEETLEDLLRPGLRAVCVGINPSRVSVRAGHYYQGRLGQLFFRRLRQVGLLPADATSYEDDALFAEGVGFTDIVKRATARAEELRAEEYAHGRTELVRKVAEADAPLVIFTYKRTAEVLFGRFSGAGLLNNRDVLPAKRSSCPVPTRRAHRWMTPLTSSGTGSADGGRDPEPQRRSRSPCHPIAHPDACAAGAPWRRGWGGCRAPSAWCRSRCSSEGALRRRRSQRGWASRGRRSTSTAATQTAAARGAGRDRRLRHRGGRRDRAGPRPDAGGLAPTGPGGVRAPPAPAGGPARMTAGDPALPRSAPWPQYKARIVAPTGAKAATDAPALTSRSQ